MIEELPTLSKIREAAARIEAHAHKTPVLISKSLNQLFDCEFFFKAENLQKTGAFKFRGACNSVFSLSDEDASCGVATHSSGNHAQALALAAKLRGIKAILVMPKNSIAAKVAAVRTYGGEIIFCENSLESRESTLAEVVAKTRSHVIHPYNDFRVIAGQATAALELISDYPELDLILVPVGGGGLLSGTALAAHYLASQIQVIAVEPEGASDAYQSRLAGKIVPSINPQTIADGLRSSIGNKTFYVMQKYVKDIVTVKEKSIEDAMTLIWQRLKTVVEPSGAVPLAAVVEQKIEVRKKRIGIILSGGNIDMPSFERERT